MAMVILMDEVSPITICQSLSNWKGGLSSGSFPG